MRDRNSRHRRPGDRGRDAGHHIDVDTGGSKVERFLPTATKDERIAALQADDRLGPPAGIDQNPIDLVLSRAQAVGILAHGDALRPRGDEVEDLGPDQAVVHDDVGLPE